MRTKLVSKTLNLRIFLLQAWRALLYLWRDRAQVAYFMWTAEKKEISMETVRISIGTKNNRVELGTVNRLNADAFIDAYLKSVGIAPYYMRYIQLSNTLTAVDYGSYVRYIFIERGASDENNN